MNTSGAYVVSGGFDKGLKGDALIGLLVLGEDETALQTGALFLRITLAGLQHVLLSPSLEGLRISRAGAVSFTVGKAGWAFTGFIAGGDISGRHGFSRPSPKRPLEGRWGARRVKGPIEEDPTAVEALAALHAFPEGAAAVAAFVQRQLGA